RPKAPIVAITFSDIVNRQLSLVWGIHAVMGGQVHSTDEMLDIAIDRGLSTKLFERGSKVIITAGVPVGESGTTNLMKVHVIGDVIANGQESADVVHMVRQLFPKMLKKPLLK